MPLCVFCPSSSAAEWQVGRVEVGQVGWHPAGPAALISKTTEAPQGSSAGAAASPSNQELIEAARSSCCYSNRQHRLAPLRPPITCFGIPVVSRPPPQSSSLHPHCLHSSSPCFCRRGIFLLCMMRLFSRAWISNHRGSRGAGKVVVICATSLQ